MLLDLIIRKKKKYEGLSKKKNVHFAGKRYPPVILQSPVRQPFNVRHSACKSSYPAARCMKPSTYYHHVKY